MLLDVMQLPAGMHAGEISALRTVDVHLSAVSERVVRIERLGELAFILKSWGVLPSEQEPDAKDIEAALAAEGLWIDPTRRWAVQLAAEGRRRR